MAQNAVKKCSTKAQNEVNTYTEIKEVLDCCVELIIQECYINECTRSKECDPSIPFENKKCKQLNKPSWNVKNCHMLPLNPGSNFIHKNFWIIFLVIIIILCVIVLICIVAVTYKKFGKHRMKRNTSIGFM